MKLTTLFATSFLLVEAATALKCYFKLYMDDKSLQDLDADLLVACDGPWKGIQTRAFLSIGGTAGVPGSERNHDRAAIANERQFHHRYSFSRTGKFSAPITLPNRRNLAMCIYYTIYDLQGKALPTDGGCGTPEEVWYENGKKASCNGCVPWYDWDNYYYAYGVRVDNSILNPPGPPQPPVPTSAPEVPIVNEPRPPQPADPSSVPEGPFLDSQGRQTPRD